LREIQGRVYGNGRLKPAKQRSLGPIVAKLSSKNEESDDRSAPEGKTVENSTPETSTRTSQCLQKQEIRRFNKKSLPQHNERCTAIGSRKVEASHAQILPRNSAVTNPLVANVGPAGVNKSRAALRAMPWPEYPKENRTALLGLMELLVARKNGDMQRFSRICGSNLSGKARSLIEGRIKKPENGSGIPAPSSANDRTSRPVSRLPNPAKSTPSKLQDIRANEDDGESESSFRDDLPALDLRAGLRDTTSGPSDIPRPSLSSSIVVSPAINDQATGLALSSSFSAASADDISFTEDDVPEKSSAAMNLYATSAAFQSSMTSLSNDAGPPGNESVGAAASLRARLLKIREKNKNTVPEVSADGNEGVEASKPQLLVEDETVSTSAASDNFRQSQEERVYSETELKESQPEVTESNAKEDSKPQMAISVDHVDKFLETIRVLLAKQTPLEENDEDVVASTDALKTIHAAVSQQAILAVGLDPTGVAKLRDEIKLKTNEVVATLTRYIILLFLFTCAFSNMHSYFHSCFQVGRLWIQLPQRRPQCRYFGASLVSKSSLPNGNI
jgi:hypothetical protein